MLWSRNHVTRGDHATGDICTRNYSLSLVRHPHPGVPAWRVALLALARTLGANITAYRTYTFTDAEDNETVYDSEAAFNETPLYVTPLNETLVYEPPAAPQPRIAASLMMAIRDTVLGRYAPSKTCLIDFACVELRASDERVVSRDEQCRRWFGSDYRSEESASTCDTLRCVSSTGAVNRSAYVAEGTACRGNDTAIASRCEAQRCVRRVEATPPAEVASCHRVVLDTSVPGDCGDFYKTCGWAVAHAPELCFSAPVRRFCCAVCHKMSRATYLAPPTGQHTNYTLLSAVPLYEHDPPPTNLTCYACGDLYNFSAECTGVRAKRRTCFGGCWTYYRDTPILNSWTRRGTAYYRGCRDLRVTPLENARGTTAFKGVSYERCDKRLCNVLDTGALYAILMSVAGLSVFYLVALLTTLAFTHITAINKRSDPLLNLVVKEAESTVPIGVRAHTESYKAMRSSARNSRSPTPVRNVRRQSSMLRPDASKSHHASFSTRPRLSSSKPSPSSSPTLIPEFRHSANLNIVVQDCEGNVRSTRSSETLPFTSC